MTASPSSVVSRHHLAHLDAVRGIAALVVVLHHAILSLPSGTEMLAPLDHVPLLGLVALGRPVVIVFFVLSGFVLTLSLLSGSQPPPVFALRRLIRLMPPFWVAILLAAVIFTLVPNHTSRAMSSWFDAQWGNEPDRLSGLSLIRHMLMLAGPTQYPLDHVSWSLAHELRLSILLPIFVLLTARCGWVRFAILCCLITMLAVSADIFTATNLAAFPQGYHAFLFDAQGVGYSLALTARFGVAFALGSSLAMSRSALTRWFDEKGIVTGLALGLSLVALSQPNEWLMTAGAGLLIGTVASSKRLARMLDLAPLTWLGKVSYSLYLTHLPIMLACGLLLDTSMPAPVAMGLAVVLSLLVAHAMYHAVEAPSIRFSRAVGARLAAWTSRRTSARAVLDRKMKAAGPGVDICRILVCLALGDVASRVLPIPLPASVVGLLLLFGWLYRRGSVPSGLNILADRTLDLFGLLFVPAGVGVVAYTHNIRADYAAIALAISVGTLVTIVATALAASVLARGDHQDANV